MILSLPNIGLMLAKTTAFLVSVDLELFPQLTEPKLAPKTSLLDKKKRSKSLKSDVLMLRIGSWKVRLIKCFSNNPNTYLVNFIKRKTRKNFLCLTKRDFV